jgi:hypothetical protein
MRGKVGPLTAKPFPVVFSAESVTCAERVLVSTTGTVELCPTNTEPNETLEGLATTPSPFAPVPLILSSKSEFEASLVMVAPPCVKPDAVGENDT